MDNTYFRLALYVGDRNSIEILLGTSGICTLSSLNPTLPSIVKRLGVEVLVQSWASGELQTDNAPEYTVKPVHLLRW